MREIKFRAWDKKKKMWTNYQIYLLDGSIRYMDKAIGTWHSDPNHERFVLTQFTGLKDKNGVEIYEGDIIKEKVCDAKVVFHMKVVFHGGAFKGKELRYEPEYNIEEFPNGKVVGNIFKNPELLEVE